MNKIIKRCPFCNTDSYIKLNNDQERRYWDYCNGVGHIQTQLPEFNACEREFLKTGMCLKCQEEIFGNGKSDKVKEYKNVK